jgi:hypothetical protein
MEFTRRGGQHGAPAGTIASSPLWFQRRRLNSLFCLQACLPFPSPSDSLARRSLGEGGLIFTFSFLLARSPRFLLLSIRKENVLTTTRPLRYTLL